MAYVITGHKIMFKSAIGYSFYPLQSIVMFKAEDKYAQMSLTSGATARVFHSLKEIEIMLGCGNYLGYMIFFRTHRQYIAALHYATSWKENNEIILENDLKVPVGKVYRKPIIKKLMSAYS